MVIRLDRWRPPARFLVALAVALGHAGHAADSVTAPTATTAHPPAAVHTPFVTRPAPGDTPGYRASLVEIAKTYTNFYYSAELTAALAEAHHGLTLAEQAGNLPDQAQFLKAVGYVSWLLGDTASALDYEQRVLGLAEKFNDDRLRSIAHRVLGSVYGQTGDDAKRREHTAAALRYAESAGDNALKYGALNNVANIALSDRDFATARRLHEEILVFREKTGDRWDAAGTLTNLADIADAERDYPRALELHEQALALRTEIGDARGQVRSLRQVGAILRKLGRTDEALARVKDALVRAEKITGHELLWDIRRELASIYEARGEFAAALSAERRATIEREALAGERARTRAAELETRFDFAKKQALIDQLERERQLREAELRASESDNARVRLQRFGLLGLLALAAVAIGALISRQRVKLAADRRVLAESQAAREAAEEADRIKTRFLAIASHDIRGPLDNIVGLISDLRGQGRLPPTEAERLDWISVEAQRVAGLAQDLLNATALEMGKLALHRTLVDFSAIIRAAVDEQRRFAQAKRLSLSLVEPPPGTALVEGDGPRLRQVAANLVSNAVKFTPPGRSVLVSLARRDAKLLFSVRDQGPGISPDEVARLFTPFTRLAAHPTASESSHGLGLSIAHEIVRLHGGKITVESQPGDGATFTVELAGGPVVTAAAPAAV